MPDGILIVDKPPDWTSMDVCARLRGVFHERRVGHAGTLDPMATGVLPVFIGRATKAVSFAENGRKEYLAALRLGIETDTQDTTGRVLREAPAEIAEAELSAALRAFRGEIRQIPPMYSAVKRGGRKLYELARKGIEVEREPRLVTIDELELLGRRPDGDWELRVLCSKGTYIRTLCRDIGAALGCGGTMSGLRRTMAAGFTLAEAVTLEQAQEEGEALLRPIDVLFRQYPAHRIARAADERRCRCGDRIPAGEQEEGTLCRVYGQDGTFLALSRCEGGMLRSVKNFFGG